MDALEGRWNSGYLRCLEHIRRLSPRLALATVNRRLVFMGAALGGILAGRETALSDQAREHPMWSDQATIAELALCLTAMVEC
jgi:hypothetical protein